MDTNLVQPVTFADWSDRCIALAAIGIHGVISYSASQRTREIGIRMALGAQLQDVLSQVVKEGMKLFLIDLGFGIITALVLTRLFASPLYGMSPADPITLVAVSLLLSVVALLACYFPARRAARVDPMIALRAE